MKKGKIRVLHLGVYEEDDPQSMVIQTFVQSSDGRTLVCGGVVKSCWDYHRFGKEVVAKLGSHEGLEKIVIHPGKIKNIHSICYPVTISVSLKFLAKGITGAGYKGKVEVESEYLNLPQRGTAA